MRVTSGHSLFDVEIEKVSGPPPTPPCTSQTDETDEIEKVSSLPLPTPSSSQLG